MSIKSLVNNRDHYQALMEYLDERIMTRQGFLASSVDIHTIYRNQGALQELEHLKQLKEKVLGRDH